MSLYTSISCWWCFSRARNAVSSYSGRRPSHVNEDRLERAVKGRRHADRRLPRGTAQQDLEALGVSQQGADCGHVARGEGPLRGHGVRVQSDGRQQDGSWEAERPIAANHRPKSVESVSVFVYYCLHE